LILLTIWAVTERSVAKENERNAIEARDQALHNESRALSALSRVALLTIAPIKPYNSLLRLGPETIATNICGLKRLCKACRKQSPKGSIASNAT
jgi:hypothetical protein